MDRPLRAGLTVAILAAVSAVLAVGCTVETSAPESDVRTSSSSLSLLGICTPLTCCFPSGGAWASNPLEDRLRELGCTAPQAYTESYQASNWWIYSHCPTSLALTSLVLEYATVSPYYSQLVVNPCLELHALGGNDPLGVFVEWDPTCPNCCNARSQ
jgi:hypothetical protein